jgi:hypothetical protein
MFEIIGLFLAIPFVLINDWFVFLRKLEPLAHALTIASHGVVMMLMAGVAIYNLHGGYVRQFPPEYRSLVYVAFAFIGVWGAYWFLIGAARSRQRRDYHYLGRAIAKVAFGIGLYYGFPHYWRTTEWWEVLAYMASGAVAAFCIVTGLTKIALLMRPLPRIDIPDDNMPEGGLGTGSGIRGS